MKSHMLETNGLGAQPKEEVSHVHVANSSVHADVLRTLRSYNFDGPGGRSSELVCLAVSHGLPSSVLDTHQNLVSESLLNQVKLYTGKHHSPETPLWISLLHSPLGGLRQVSKEWLHASTVQLAAFGLPSPAQFTVANVTSPLVTYRLAHFEFVSRFLNTSVLLDRFADLPLRIRVAIESPSLELLNDIWSFSQTSEKTIVQSILASFVVRAKRSKFEIDSSIVEELYCWAMESVPVVSSDDDRLRVCHVLNSINYVWSSIESKQEATSKIISTIKDAIAPRLSSVRLANHLIGNAYYHSAILSGVSGDSEGELNHLLLAEQFDQRFSDYSYRIAQLHHDRGDAVAKTHYEKALSTSAFNFSLVNDYGCLLSDLGLTEDLASWELVAKLFFPTAEKGPQ